MKTAIFPAPIWTTKKSSSANSRGGFTLVELIIVVAIIGMLTGVVAVRLRGPYRQARFEDVLQRVAVLDGQVRSYTQRFGKPQQLMVDMQNDVLYTRNPGGGRGLSFRETVAGSADVDRVLLPEGPVGGGTATINFSEDGQARSYAVSFRLGKQQVWLLFSGVTGQVTQLDGETDVREIFQLLADKGPDAG